MNDLEDYQYTIAELRDEVARLTKQKDTACTERNRVVELAAKLALGLGL
jgi:hypothetical protein